jgi:hypothetical protein
MAGLVPAISLRRELLRPCDRDTRDKPGHDSEAAAGFLFVVQKGGSRYIARMLATAHRIVIADHARLPWRFFGRLTCAQTGL